MRPLRELGRELPGVGANLTTPNCSSARNLTKHHETERNTPAPREDWTKCRILHETHGNGVGISRSSDPRGIAECRERGAGGGVRGRHPPFPMPAFRRRRPPSNRRSRRLTPNDMKLHEKKIELLLWISHHA